MLKPQRGVAWARIGAELGLFLFGALAICLPVGLAPFGFVLVTTSVLYFGRLRRATSEIAAPLRFIFISPECVAVVVAVYHRHAPGVA